MDTNIIDDNVSKTRKFSADYYFMMSKSGIKIPRLWLCYSVELNKSYCESCWLFADRNYPYFKYSWIEGINDWQHLSQKIAKHEKSVQHIEAVKLRTIWIKNQTIDVNLEKQISVEAKFWRDVLTRIIKIILFLTAGNTALRGNEGKGEEACEGNFLRTVRLLAEFDPVLNTLLTVEENKVKYLSWSTQNEVIDLLATNVQNIICQEIRKAPCFALIIDSTQDICKVDQVSVIIRYTSLNYTLQTIDIKESFLGFFTLHEHAAKDHVNLILETLIKFGIDINKCRGQGFDGASVMSGIHNGVKKRILDIVPNATYIHCNAHNLNLVLSDVARSTTKVSSFFDTIQEIFNFFSKSGPRWASLSFGDNVANIIKKKVLKKVCVTRWEARHDAVYVLKDRYIDVLKSLTNISLTSRKTEERTKSIGLKNKIESFEFVLLLTIWENILRLLYSVSKLLQSPNTTLHQACELLENCVRSIKSLRTNYDEIVASSKILCSKWGISTQPKSHRRVFAKKYFDEINHVDEDRRIDITEDNFRVTVFLPIIDTALSQLQGRFEGMKTVHNNFEFLTPTVIKDSEESELLKSAYDFVQFYQKDISSDFPRQLLSLKENLKNMKLKTIRDLSNFILENDLCSVYSDVMTACIIFNITSDCSFC